MGWRPAPQRVPDGWADVARRVAIAGLAGIPTGIAVGGVGGRIFMRIAGATGSDAAQGRLTEAGFRVGQITLGGSIALIVFVGLFAGIIGAVLYVVFEPWMAWAGRFRGLVFGVVLFSLGSATSDVMNPDNRDFFILRNDMVNVVSIAALFLVFGVAFEEVHRVIDRRVPVGDSRMTSVFAAVAGAGALIGLPLVVSTMIFGSEATCGCDPPLVAGLFALVAGVGTLVWWASARHERLRVGASIIGYVGLLGATGFGLARALSDAAEILG